MESITKYYRRVQATFILTAFCVIAAAVLFAPSFGRFVHTGDNVADILLNGVVVAVRMSGKGGGYTAERQGRACEG